MAKVKWGTILNKKKLTFKNNYQLEKYYEKKYKEGGYKGVFTLHGVNISSIYHHERQKSALKFLGLKSKDVVLDAGCGNGVLTLQIAKKANKVVGIDIAKNAFKLITNKPKNLVLEKMNMEDMKFRDN